MPLTGIPTNSPDPGTKREIIFGAGDSLGAGGARTILLYGNKTSAGSETVETIGTAIQGDQDCKDRFGARSEVYQEYRAATYANKTVTYYAIAVTEAGTAATCTFTFVNAATDTTTCDVTWGSLSTSFTVNSGDAIATIATNLANAINNADGGTWPFTGAGVAGVTTITTANTGDRTPLALVGLRVSFRKSVTTTITKSATSGGATADDFTTAYSVAASGTYYYQASPKTSTSGVTATDNGIGEHIALIQTQALPINGRGQMVVFGLVGTNAQAITVATSTGANEPRARFIWQENNDWTPGMLAAHHAAIFALGHAIHPAYNFTRWANSAATPYVVPPPFSKADVPTSTEVTAALNSGVCPVNFLANGAPFFVREVTSKSLLTGTSTNDYRIREGHITSAIDFTWDSGIFPTYEAQKQPYLAADPPQGVPPLPNVTYPRSVKALATDIIKDFAGASPLGLYRGPILAPDKVGVMIDTMVAAKIAGGISLAANLFAVEHNNKAEFTLRETSAAQ